MIDFYCHAIPVVCQSYNSLLNSISRLKICKFELLVNKQIKPQNKKITYNDEDSCSEIRWARFITKFLHEAIKIIKKGFISATSLL
jgi:hypothetical protein